MLAEDIWFKNVETIQAVLNTCAYLHNMILRYNGRDQVGTQDDHFNPLRPGFDAETLDRYRIAKEWGEAAENAINRLPSEPELVTVVSLVIDSSTVENATKDAFIHHFNYNKYTHAQKYKSMAKTKNI